MIARPLRVQIALPGLHLVQRGAEVALEAIAAGLARDPAFEVTLLGAGSARADDPYRFVQLPMTPRKRFERFPKFPPLRNEFRWEELTFAWPLWWRSRRERPDVTMTCSYPFVSWVQRGARNRAGGRARHVFVTENGDHPARRLNSEYKLFRCDGLVCTNPDYYEVNRATWQSALIPNGVDVDTFSPGPGARGQLGLPDSGPLVVMVSALIPSKHAALGVRAVAALDGACLAIAGDGPLRDEVDALGRELLGARYARITLDPARMPSFYRSADVFLHLSRDEAFGNVYVEAMACGLPVVAHDYTTSRWILSDQAHLLDTSNPEDTAAALRAALAEPAGAAGRRHAAMRERFAWPVVVAAYREFLLEVLRAGEEES